MLAQLVILAVAAAAGAKPAPMQSSYTTTSEVVSGTSYAVSGTESLPVTSELWSSYASSTYTPTYDVTTSWITYTETAPASTITYTETYTVTENPHVTCVLSTIDHIGGTTTYDVPSATATAITTILYGSDAPITWTVTDIATTYTTTATDSAITLTSTAIPWESVPEVSSTFWESIPEITATSIDWESVPEGTATYWDGTSTATVDPTEVVTSTEGSTTEVASSSAELTTSAEETTTEVTSSAEEAPTPEASSD